MTTHRNHLLARLAIPLLGLLITIQFLVPEKGLEATSSKNALVERLLLKDSDGIEVVQSGTYSKGQLFQHYFFHECFQDRQVWAAFQTLRAGRFPLCLYFVDFRSSEDAIWAKKRLESEPPEFIRCRSLVAGTALVYAQSNPDTPLGVLDGVLQTVEAKNR